jgi:hypothetical protein
MKVSLWVFIASNERQGALHVVWADCFVVARTLARGWIEQAAERGLCHVEARYYPGGFTAGDVEWPGAVEQASSWPDWVKQAKDGEENHATAE